MSRTDSAAATFRSRALAFLGRRGMLGARGLVNIASWGALIAFTVIGIGAPLFGIGTFQHTEIFTGTAPWSSVLADPTPIANILVGDTIDAKAPQSMLIVESVRNGALGTWTPYSAGGFELGSLPTSSVFSPLSLPWWVLPFYAAPAAVKFLEIVAITVGMSLLLRRLRLPSASWAIASLVYASSGFMVAWTGWSQTRVAALIPLLVWAIDGAVSTGRIRWIVPIGLVLAGMLQGGFPAVVAYALYLGGAYALARAIVVHRRLMPVLRAGLVALGGVILGFLLSAWLLLPFAVNASTVIDFSIRQQTPDNHLPLRILASAIVPSINGGPGEVGAWDGHPVERYSFIGVVAVVLLLAAVLFRDARHRRQMVIFFGVAFALCITLVYLGGPVLAAAQELPVMSSNLVNRVRVLVGFLAAILAAYGFAAVIRPRDAELHSALPDRVDRAVRWAIAAVIVLGSAYLVATTYRLVPGASREIVLPEVVWALVLGMIAFAAAVAVVRWPAFLAVAAVIPIALSVQATASVSAWWAPSTHESYYADTPTHRFLANELGGDRFVSVGRAMTPGTETAYRIRSFGGHNFLTQEWKDLVTAVDPVGLASPTYIRLHPEGLSESISSPVLDRYGVRFVVAEPNLAPLGTVEEVPAPGSVEVRSGAVLRSAEQAGPVTGLRIDFDPGAATAEEGVRLLVRLVAPDGEELASTETWYRNVPASSRWVALQADALPADQAWVAEATLIGASEPIAATATDGGDLAIALMRPPADGDVRVAHTGDATVYERLTAGGRVHWASDETVVADAGERIDAMASGDVDVDTVILEDPADTIGASGSSATVVDLAPDALDSQRYSIEADGTGWLVVEDSFRRPGWTATVDGEPAELVPADHAAAAIAVPAGVHEVELTYTAPGRALGLATTGGTVLLLLAWGVIAAVRRRPAADQGPGERTG